MTFSLPPVPFYFLRHGVTDHNLRRLVMGQLDIPLNDQGRRQAEQAAICVSALAIATIVCSPLSRARETAEIIAARLGLSVIVVEDLRERDWGSASGRPYRELTDRVLPAGAESAELFARRIMGVAAVLAGNNPVLMVSHSGVCRALRRSLAIQGEGGPVPNAVPLLFSPQAGGGWREQPLPAAAVLP